MPEQVRLEKLAVDDGRDGELRRNPTLSLGTAKGVSVRRPALRVPGTGLFTSPPREFRYQVPEL